MNVRDDLPAPDFDGPRRRALAAAVIGGALCAVAWLAGPQAFVRSYLVGFLFWVGISVGCAAVLMLHRLVGGIWGFVIRRPAEAGAATVPLMALLFVPIALGLRDLYPWAAWADPSRAKHDPAIEMKVRYLNVAFFLVRAAIYFGIWTALALLLNRGGTLQDRIESPEPTRRLQMLSGPGLALYFLSVTFAMIDWGMSLEPDWFSSIYGAMLLVGQALATLATLIIIGSWVDDAVPLPRPLKTEGFHDLGKLLLAFVMLWAYMSFSQYLISWSGNLADEVPWYLRRSAGGWRPVAVMLIVFHFFVPFFLLLSRDRKRDPRSLAKVAWLILAVRLVDVTWLVLPAFKHLEDPSRDPSVLQYWGVLPAMLGIGGLWMAVFLGRLRSAPLLPRNDPQLADVLEHHGE